MEDNKKQEEIKEDDIFSGNNENPNYQGKNWVNGAPVKKTKETVIITILLMIIFSGLTLGIIINFFSQLF